MTLVLIGNDLVLKGSTTKIEDKQVPGRRYSFVSSETIDANESPIMEVRFPNLPGLSTDPPSQIEGPKNKIQHVQKELGCADRDEQAEIFR